MLAHLKVDPVVHDNSIICCMYRRSSICTTGWQPATQFSNIFTLFIVEFLPEEPPQREKKTAWEDGSSNWQEGSCSQGCSTIEKFSLIKIHDKVHNKVNHAENHNLSVVNSGTRCEQGDEKDLQRCLRRLLLFPSSLPCVQFNLSTSVLHSHWGQPWTLVKGLLSSPGPQFERSEYVPYLFWPRFIVHPDLCCRYCQGKIYSEKVAVYASLIFSCLLLAPTMISFVRWGKPFFMLFYFFCCKLIF